MNAELDNFNALRNAKCRRCHLCLWSNYFGLGFTLAPALEPPYIIESVESNSPAAAGGLRIRDIVLAVNDKNTFELSFDELKNIIQNARDAHGRIELLMIGPDFYETPNKSNEPINPRFVKTIKTPQTMPIDYQNFPKHQPRTCEMRLNRSDTSFGFQTVDPLTSVGMLIQEVYPNSPAANTSLRKCDRIIEIDDEFIDNVSSRTILEKLHTAQEEQHVKLYVVDTATYEFFQSNNIPLSSKEYRQSTFAKKFSPDSYIEEDKRPKIDDVKSQYEEDDNKSFNQLWSHRRVENSDMVILSNTFGNSEFDVYQKGSHSIDTEIHDDKKQTSNSNNINSSCLPIHVCKGDLITQETDVIVVSSSSQRLFKSICKAGGSSVLASYNAKLNNNPEAPIIVVKADGQLASKIIYFLSLKPSSDTSILCRSIEKFVSDALEKATKQNYRSIAFPAISCDQFRCSPSIVACTMVREVYRKLKISKMSVSFVIKPEKTDIYDEFLKQIHLLEPTLSSLESRTICATFKRGIIEVEMGDITMQKVDVIIGSSSSNILRKAIIKAAGNETQAVYDLESTTHPNSVLIATPAGALPCKQIFFVKWEPDSDEKILEQSLVDLIYTVVQNVKSHRFTSIALPAIGCGKHGCSIDIVVKTMVLEMKKNLIKRNLPWTVKFVVEPDQENIYDEFRKQVFTTQDGLHEVKIYRLPPTWEKSSEHKIRIKLSPIADEYRSIVSNFDQAMKENYTKITKIERIQNERWYMQYLAHKEDFERRLNMNTEKILYHGCPEQAAHSIIQDCFNRSFAGVNGKFNLGSFVDFWIVCIFLRVGNVYGFGVYFSSDAAYSHGFTTPNAKKRRCMFIARVLVGKTTKGNSSMKTRPLGFDSTTDGDHIFVTYHDAQAFAEYLITYK
ncbi:unnamed protein product [Rotaria sp. Silwood2]|nr:unnamed protein product [Rotaria sp. Silwood2]